MSDSLSLARIRFKRWARRASLALIQTPIAPIAAAIAAQVRPARGHSLRGQILEIRDRSLDQTEAWRDLARVYPENPEFLRRMAHAALRAGRISDAEEAVQMLAVRGQLGADDAKYIIGLIYVDHARGDFSAIRKRLRWFLTALQSRRDYFIATLRLSRVILAYYTTPKRAQARAFPSLLSRADVSPASRALLHRVYNCEQSLKAGAPTSFLDTDISAAQGSAFIALIRDRLKSREPFSFVRIGDGEAACLSYEPRFSSLAAGDRRARESIWWGKPLPNQLSKTLRDRVSGAIWDADAIGLPTLGRYLRELNLTKNDGLENGLTGRGLRAILHAAEHWRDLRPAGLAPPVFTSCHLHQDLQRWNLYGELLDGVREVVLVSCHPELSSWMENRFNVRIVTEILLPPVKVSAPKLRKIAHETRPLPFILDEVATALGNWPQGRMVLIGGGYPGKWLVQEAKRRGGIALDVGSIFDYWLGLATRSYLDLSPV